jgi:hypothetical protein
MVIASSFNLAKKPLTFARQCKPRATTSEPTQNTCSGAQSNMGGHEWTTCVAERVGLSA